MKHRTLGNKAPVLRALAGALLSAGLLTAPLTAQPQALRPEVGKPLQQAGELLKANKAKEALAKVREAENAPNRTPQENLMIDRMRGAAAIRAGDNPTAIKSFESAFASGKLAQAEQAQIAQQLAFAYSANKEWGKTKEWAQKAQQLGGNNPQLTQLLAYVSSQSGDYAAIAKDAAAAIAAAEAAGRKPEETDLLRLADAQQRTGNPAGQAATLEKLLANYPKKEYWSIFLGRLQAKPGFSGRLTLDLYRLRLATGNLTTAEDYVEMAQLALQERQAAEAKKILDQGFKAGVLGKGEQAERQNRLLALAEQRVASAPEDLKAAEAEGLTDKDGNALVRTGLAYTGLGQYDKGIALIQQGIAKGGLRNPADANLHLGLAYLRAGNKTGAAQAFRKVSGSDGAADLARLWQRV